ncbi:MAG: DUF1194 domain-containing protein [Rhodospirillales bacterium]|nr:DUF1194 domain-containing protein [Rhodospirillales bacterium]
MRWALAVLAVLIATAPHGRAGEPVDLTLVLVSDVSRSIDDSEYALEKQGYATAFTDPDVLAAITGGAVGAVAVSYVEFAARNQVTTLVGWTVIRDAASARAFAHRLLDAGRTAWGRTSISAGLSAAIKLQDSSGFVAARRVIDVCGDGTNNNGDPVAPIRDAAVEGGMVVNGLAIINDHPVSWIFAHVQPPGGLAKYYRENVTGGVGSFVLEVHDFASFAAAMKRKLISEIAAVGPSRFRIE